MTNNNLNKLEIYSDDDFVGILNVSAKGRNETYFFQYDNNWLKNGYEIDPLLPLNKERIVSTSLWGAFCDICPDRWGKIIQKRNAGKLLSQSEYMLGGSDYFRVGALRIKSNNIFVSPTNDIPKFTSIEELKSAVVRIENSSYTNDDLRLLISSASSLGGARPKASIQDKKVLYIAKFPSKNDTYAHAIFEKTMLDVARVAKIETCDSKLLDIRNEKVIIVKRFDRKAEKRIPFKSAMTALGIREGESSENMSYVDFADKLDTKNKKELFRRMVFNALFGNTDDHLQNHALLYDRKTKSWNLSPAYDLNPTPYPYEKQNHALNFIDKINLPSIKLCKEIREFFEIIEAEFVEILKDMLNAQKQFAAIALMNGAKSNDLKLFKNNYEHSDFLECQNEIEQFLKKENVI